MNFKYKEVPRKNPLDQSVQAKYYASPIYNGNFTLKELAKQISDLSTISRVDTLAVLDAFLYLIPDQLKSGMVIRLGDFGSFRLTLSSHGAENTGILTSNHIKKAHVRFRAGKEFGNQLKSINFEKD